MRYINLRLTYLLTYLLTYSYLKTDKISKSEGIRKVEYAYHYCKCADDVYHKSSKLLHACQNCSLPKIARFLRHSVYVSSGLFSSRSDVLELAAQKLAWPVTYCCCLWTITKNISFLRVLVYTVHQRHICDDALYKLMFYLLSYLLSGSTDCVVVTIPFCNCLTT